MLIYMTYLTINTPENGEKECPEEDYSVVNYLNCFECPLLFKFVLFTLIHPPEFNMK